VLCLHAAVLCLQRYITDVIERRERLDERLLVQEHVAILQAAEPEDAVELAKAGVKEDTFEAMLELDADGLQTGLDELLNAAVKATGPVLSFATVCSKTFIDALIALKTAQELRQQQ
jgi:hypothetical protein